MYTLIPSFPSQVTPSNPPNSAADTHPSAVLLCKDYSPDTAAPATLHYHPAVADTARPVEDKKAVGSTQDHWDCTVPVPEQVWDWASIQKHQEYHLEYRPQQMSRRSRRRRRKCRLQFRCRLLLMVFRSSLLLVGVRQARRWDLILG